jgi:DNA-binding MarR family transcriptional regulator
MPFPSSSEDAVELSAEDARQLMRLLGLLLKRELQPSDWNALRYGERRSEPKGRDELVATARALFAERKRRSMHFSPVMFGEPGWEMLLVLYVGDFDGGRQTIGKLAGSIGAPQTTALRWIDYLEKERLISRQPDPLDRRTVVVEITDKGRQKLEDYLSTYSDRAQ